MHARRSRKLFPPDFPPLQELLSKGDLEGLRAYTMPVFSVAQVIENIDAYGEPVIQALAKVIYDDAIYFSPEIKE